MAGNIANTEKCMRARMFLRVASILTLFFGLGHTLGFPWVGRATPELLSKLAEIRAMSTVTEGFARSYWDFHVGFGLYISLMFLATAILLWRVGSLSGAEPRLARTTAVVFCGLFVADVTLNFMYFFWLPIAFAAAIAASLAAAAFLLPPAAP
jgi:hypothetical protein